MDKEQIARDMHRLALDLTGLIGCEAGIAKNYLHVYAEQLRRLAREVDQLPEPGRMRDVVKKGMRW